jgi:hypothetical protein
VAQPVVREQSGAAVGAVDDGDVERVGVWGFTSRRELIQATSCSTLAVTRPPTLRATMASP